MKKTILTAAMVLATSVFAKDGDFNASDRIFLLEERAHRTEQLIEAQQQLLSQLLSSSNANKTALNEVLQQLNKHKQSLKDLNKTIEKNRQEQIEFEREVNRSRIAALERELAQQMQRNTTTKHPASEWGFGSVVGADGRIYAR